MENLIPALALLACPVGMGLMMLFMGKGMMGGRRKQDPEPTASGLDDLRDEHDRLGREIQQLENTNRERVIAS